jgi:hypothetical protein
VTPAEHAELDDLRRLAEPWGPRRVFLEALSRVAAARAEVVRSSQFAHLGAGQLAAWQAARQALAEAEAEAAIATAAERARVAELRARQAERDAIVPPGPGDREVLERLDRLRRTTLPHLWEQVLRESPIEADRRALRHLGWYRQSVLGR